MTTLHSDYKLAGRFKLQRIKADTGEVVETREFKNLITDIGLNRVGSASAHQFVYVSTNATPPSVADTSLAGFVASTSTTQSTVTNSTSSSPYWYEYTITRRFGAGVAAGNLAKVGIGWTANSIDGLWSSALILDGGGSPTALTVLSDEFLDVSYTLRYYPPLTDSTATVTISGITHTIVSRAAQITSRTVNLPAAINLGATPTFYGGAATLGPLTGSITGSTGSAPGGSISPVAYVNNSLQAKGSLSAGLNVGNIAGGITGIFVPNISGSMITCPTQMTISPAIAKDNTKTLALTFAVSWSRYP